MNTPSKRSVLHTCTIYDSPNLLADLEPTLLGHELGKPGIDKPGVGTTQMRLKKGVCATECLAGATAGDTDTQALTTTQPTDLLVALPNAELVAFTPEMSHSAVHAPPVVEHCGYSASVVAVLRHTCLASESTTQCLSLM